MNQTTAKSLSLCVFAVKEFSMTNQGVCITALILILIFGTSAFAQSGRRTKSCCLRRADSDTGSKAVAQLLRCRRDRRSLLKRDQDYRCTDDGTLAHLLDHDQVCGFSPKEVDVKAEITAKPEPRYTREADASAFRESWF